MCTVLFQDCIEYVPDKSQVPLFNHLIMLVLALKDALLFVFALASI
jgi:hypothetical protein